MYRFNLKGTEVSCDSAVELLTALGTDSEPTTPTKRAYKKRKKTGAAGRSWAIARFYAQKRGVEFNVKAARAHLAANPKMKAKIEQEMVAAGV